jgi:hypothetical protein
VSFSSDGTLEQDQSGRIRIQSEAAIKQFGFLTFSYVADLEPQANSSYNSLQV